MSGPPRSPTTSPLPTRRCSPSSAPARRSDGVADTAEGIDRVNAAHALRAEGVGPAETLVLLESNAAQLESALRALTDEELDRCATFGPAGGRELPTVDLAVVTARHAREHLAHAREAVNGQA